jgi:hypothetical protein
MSHKRPKINALDAYRPWLGQPAVWRKHVGPEHDEDVACVVRGLRWCFGRVEAFIEPTDPPSLPVWTRIEKITLNQTPP